MLLWISDSLFVPMLVALEAGLRSAVGVLWGTGVLLAITIAATAAGRAVSRWVPTGPTAAMGRFALSPD